VGTVPEIMSNLDKAYAQVVGRVLLKPTDIHVNMVLDEDVYAAVEAMQDDLRDQGARSNRSEAIRLLLAEGIAAMLYRSIDPEDYNAMKVATIQHAQAMLAEGQGQA
jgi:hypothetical protein